MVALAAVRSSSHQTPTNSGYRQCVKVSIVVGCALTALLALRMAFTAVVSHPFVLVTGTIALAAIGFVAFRILGRERQPSVEDLRIQQEAKKSKFLAYTKDWWQNNRGETQGIWRDSQSPECKELGITFNEFAQAVLPYEVERYKDDYKGFVERNGYQSVEAMGTDYVDVKNGWRDQFLAHKKDQYLFRPEETEGILKDSQSPACKELDITFTEFAQAVLPYEVERYKDNYKGFVERNGYQSVDAMGTNYDLIFIGWREAALCSLYTSVEDTLRDFPYIFDTKILVAKDRLSENHPTVLDCLTARIAKCTKYEEIFSWPVDVYTLLTRRCEPLAKLVTRHLYENCEELLRDAQRGQYNPRIRIFLSPVEVEKKYAEALKIAGSTLSDPQQQHLKEAVKLFKEYIEVNYAHHIRSS